MDSHPPNIRTTEMLFLDDVFAMGDGYVLNFSDPTFSRFFKNELNVNIDDARYRTNGHSKAKRFRTFVQVADKHTVANALEALWEYREVVRKRAARVETIENAHEQLLRLCQRLRGTVSPRPTHDAAQTQPNEATLAALRSDLMTLSSLDPQPRGYAFEKFLKTLFDVYSLEARDAFRLRGEQIDGSFQLSSETYLLEAKWQNLRCGVEELHAFHGKLEQKATWARGLFVSNSGFTDEGLDAFGRGKRVICMDGLDLYEILNRNLSLSDVLYRKVRRAAETGLPFVRIRDLFTT